MVRHSTRPNPFQGRKKPPLTNQPDQPEVPAETEAFTEVPEPARPMVSTTPLGLSHTVIRLKPENQLMHRRFPKPAPPVNRNRPSRQPARWGSFLTPLAMVRGTSAHPWGSCSLYMCPLRSGSWEPSTSWPRSC